MIIYNLYLLLIKFYIIFNFDLTKIILFLLNTNLHNIYFHWQESNLHYLKLNLQQNNKQEL